MGRQDKIVAIGSVGVNKVIQQRPFQPRAHTGVHPVACTCQLYAPLIVDKAQVLAQVHMVLGSKVKFRLFAHITQGLIVFLAAGL